MLLNKLLDLSLLGLNYTDSVKLMPLKRPKGLEVSEIFPNFSDSKVVLLFQI